MRFDVDYLVCTGFFAAIIFAVVAVLAANSGNVLAFTLAAINCIAAYILLQKSLDKQQKKP